MKIRTVGCIGMFLWLAVIVGFWAMIVCVAGHFIHKIW